MTAEFRQRIDADIVRWRKMAGEIGESAIRYEIRYAVQEPGPPDRCEHADAVAASMARSAATAALRAESLVEFLTDVDELARRRSVDEGGRLPLRRSDR